MLKFFIIGFLFVNTLFANILQDVIDKAPSGSILKLPNGVYEGNIVIDKPLSIIGQGKNVIIKGDNKGTVITIIGSYITLKNLIIIDSGSRHENLDAGIKISDGSQNEVSNCKIKNCLFGIDMQMVNNSIISNNYITSKNYDLGLRGDGLRLWYANDNLINHNHLYKSRDMVVWYSHGNTIEKNLGEYCRYSLHFMYAGKNYVKNNIYKFNSVGIFFMYSQDTIATGNIVQSSQGATGMGIGLKDATNFTLKGNTVLYCAMGMYIDRSPFQPGTHDYIIGNKLLYNAEAIHFHSLSIDNIVKKNIIIGNIEDIVNDSKRDRGEDEENEVVGNYWDNYQGFDKNNDNIGDTPHKVYQYADQLWVFNSDVKFFYGSPVISLLNFLAKLAPFSKPLFLMEDKKPIVKIKG